MKKNIVIGSILAAVIIVLATCTPAVCAIGVNSENKVTITTTFYQFIKKEEIVIEVSEEEAEEVMDNLEHLRQALIEGDKQLIEKYESLLIDKRIFGENNKIFSKKGMISKLRDRYRSMELNNPSILADENSLCFVNSRGKGGLGFMFDDAFYSLVMAGVILLVMCALIPPLIPILGPAMVLSLFGGIAGITIAHLIPFRILYPTLKMNLSSGDCSIIGLKGSQQYTAPVDAVFSGFNGLTVNIWKWSDVEPNVFLLGFALKSVVS